MPSARARRPARTSRSQALNEHFDKAVELLADNELHPALPEAALQVIRGQMALSVAARNASPGFLTQRSLRAALFPGTDPSLRMSTPESVRALTPATVRAYYQQRVSSGPGHHRGHRQGHPAGRASHHREVLRLLDGRRGRPRPSTCRRCRTTRWPASPCPMPAGCRTAWCWRRRSRSNAPTRTTTRCSSATRCSVAASTRRD